MPLCPRYITPCHPNSGVDKSAPSLQTVARICVPLVNRAKQAQWHSWSRQISHVKGKPCRRSGADGVASLVSLSFLPHQRPRTSGSSDCFPPAVSARRIFSERIATVALFVWAKISKFSSNTSQPSGPVALLVRCQFPNQAGHSGAVGQGFGDASFH